MRCGLVLKSWHAFVAPLVVASAAACAATDGQELPSTPDAGPTSSTALGSVEALARPDRALNRALALTEDGWRLDGDAFSSPGFRSRVRGALAARLAPTADGVLDLRVARSEDQLWVAKTQCVAGSLRFPATCRRRSLRSWRRALR